MRTLIDFADERGIKVDTISQYIRRNNKKMGFEEHWSKNEQNQIIIDAWLEEILAEKYHAMPVMGHNGDDLKRIADLEAREKFLMEKLLMVQEKMQQQSEMLREAEQQTLRIETKKAETEMRLELLKESYSELKTEAENAKQEAASYKKTFFGLYRKEK